MALFSPKQQEQVQPQQQDTNQGSVSEAEQVSQENLRERRYLWTARGFAMIFIVSLITNILMLMSLSSLTPLVRVQPYELTFSDKKSQTVQITPFALDQNAKNAISESMLRRYVTARHTITSDKTEMVARWDMGGLVQLLSSDSVFDTFKRNATNTLERAFAVSETRNVIIRTVMPYYKDWWQVSLDLEITSPEKMDKEVLHYVATARVGFYPTKGTWAKRLNNPVGFQVLEYAFETEESFKRREKQRLE